MNLPSNSKRSLTVKQQDFLNNLIETKGNLKLSAELAGYAGNHYQVITSLRQNDWISIKMSMEVYSYCLKNK